MITTEVKERPLLFKGEMVRAILEGRKTNTRRLNGLEAINANPDQWSVTWQGVEEKSGRWAVQFDAPKVTECVRCSYGKPGDLLWVRETWCCKMNDGEHVYLSDGRLDCYYRSTEPDHVVKDDGNGGASFRSNGVEASPWRPSIFMPRWASRITLEIVSVRVERVQDISERDAIDEGIDMELLKLTCVTPQNVYRKLWDSINGKTFPWSSNPFCWVISFRRVKP